MGDGLVNVDVGSWDVLREVVGEGQEARSDRAASPAVAPPWCVHVAGQAPARGRPWRWPPSLTFGTPDQYVPSYH